MAVTRTDRSPEMLPAGSGRVAVTLALGLSLMALGLQGAAAQSFNAPKQEAPQVGGDASPPVDIKFDLVDGKARCEPPELRLPARTDVQVKITNASDENAVIAAPRLFSNEFVLHHEGDLVHAASNQGYTLKARGTGHMRLRTPPPGDYEFTCAQVRDLGSPYKGKLTLVQTQPETGPQSPR